MDEWVGVCMACVCTVWVGGCLCMPVNLQSSFFLFCGGRSGGG